MPRESKKREDDKESEKPRERHGPLRVDLEFEDAVRAAIWTPAPPIQSAATRDNPDDATD